VEGCTLRASSSNKAPADVAVLTVIQPELFAALDALGIPITARETDPHGTIYYRGALRSYLAGCAYQIVVTCIGSAGNPSATAAARDVIARYEPRVVLLIGIAAGLRGKVRIGDVVLSERVVAYEPGAAVVGEDGSPRVTARPEVDRLPHAMNQQVVSYRHDEERLRSLFTKLGGRFPEAPPGREDEFREHVASALTVRPATIASGEKLLRDPGKLRLIREEQHSKVDVGEMEAAGLVEACRRGNVPWLIVRGISDFGDELKDDRFHDFASRAAAAVTADFLAHGLDLPKAAIGVRRVWGGVGAVGALALLVGVVAFGRCETAGTGGARVELKATPSGRSAVLEPPTAPEPVVVELPFSAAAPPEVPMKATAGAPAGTREAPLAVASERSEPAASGASVAPAAPPSGTASGTAKMKLKDVTMGHNGKLRGGNVEGSGSTDIETGNITCGDNCEVDIGNVKKQ
jgi:nucleoside phosphorylase